MHAEKDFSTLKGYLGDDGKFSMLPGKKQKKKLDLMLAFFAEKFEAGKMYSEPEVNELLNKHHSFNDAPTLRRMLIGTGVLDRVKDGSKYWVK